MWIKVIDGSLYFFSFFNLSRFIISCNGAILYDDSSICFWWKKKKNSMFNDRINAIRIQKGEIASKNLFNTPQSATEKCKKRQLQALFYAFQNIDIVTRTCFTSSPLKLHQRRGIIRIFVSIK